MTIIRTRLSSDGYTIIPNHWSRDPNLSWKAKGLLAYIASHTEGYELRTEQIIREGVDGRDAVLSGLRELEERGYLRRHYHRNSLGHVKDVIFEVFEHPEPPGQPPPPPGNPDPDPGKPKDGFPVGGSAGEERTPIPKNTKVQEQQQLPPPAVADEPVVSAEVIEPPPSVKTLEQPKNAGQMTSQWIDYCCQRGVRLTPTLIKRYAAKFKELLTAGFTPPLIGAALQLMVKESVVARVTMLDTYLIRVQAGPERPEPLYRSAAERRRQEADDAGDLIDRAERLVVARGGDDRDNAAVYAAMQELKNGRSGGSMAETYTHPTLLELTR